MSPRGKERPKVCGTCNGKGKTFTRVNVTECWERTCPTCNGEGVVKPPCELCHGTHIVGTVTQGLGYVGCACPDCGPVPVKMEEK